MENHKYKRRSRDYHENGCEDSYVNGYYDSYRDRNKYKHQYRNDRCDKIRGRPKEKPCSHDDKNCDSSYSELEELYKTLLPMTSKEATAIRSNLMTSEYINEVMDSTCLMAARVKYAISHKSKGLTKDIYDNIGSTSSQSDVNSVNYEPENLGTGLTQNSDSEESIEVVGDGEEPIESIEGINVCDTVELQDLPCRIVEVDMQDFPTTIVDELELWESIEIPGIPISLAEGQVLEEFMLEEETDFWGIDKCKIVELPDKQEIERCVSPEISVRMACEQEEFTKEEIFDRSLTELPELYKAQESIHKDDIQLETPREHTMEVSELPREIKLEIPIEQSKSKLHTKQKKISGPEVVRRANPTKLVKREICRPLLNHQII